MRRIYELTLRNRRVTVIATIVLTLICGILAFNVTVNYDMSKYLPEEAPVVGALDKMTELYGNLPSVSVYAPCADVAAALDMKSRLEAAKGVTGVMWLDDVTDVTAPLETLDAGVVSAWYKDGAALFSVTVDSSDVVSTVAALREAAGENAVLSGDSVNQSVMQHDNMREVALIMAYLVPLVLIVLLLTTTSWFLPALFFMAIGAAIVVNMGTNAFFGEISFVTQATSAILQLAVSMDYAVFLLNQYSKYRAEGKDVQTAMLDAMHDSSVTIAASAMTTVFGFLSLMLMSFGIGPDMGLVLAKGVFASYLSVMFFLPALATACAPLIEKTTHRKFTPPFVKLGKFAARACVPIAIIVVLLILPAYITQGKNDFTYGASGMHSEDSKVHVDSRYIEEAFGRSQQLVMLVPDSSPDIEADLSRALEETANVAGVVSYANSVGEIPEIALEPEQLALFREGGFSRIVIYADVDDEGDNTFRLVEQLREAAEARYPGQWYLAGEIVVNYDMRESITGDTLTVLAAAVLSILLIIHLAFKRLITPLILVLTIESAIWINMALPYLIGGSLSYIGYQIISSVQLGATVDYGILLTSKYLAMRQELPKRESASAAVAATAESILTPALILIIAGGTLYFLSTNGVISQMGGILASGTAISAAMVLIFLPGPLMLFDKLIKRRRKKCLKK